MKKKTHITLTLSIAEAEQLRINLGSQSEEVSRRLHKSFPNVTPVKFSERILEDIFARICDELEYLPGAS